MHLNKKHVLVMGDDVRSFLSVVRSLGSKGLYVDSCSENHLSHALCSKYIHSVYSLPPYDLDNSKWVASLSEILCSKKYDLIIPCNDRSIIPIMENIEKFKKFPIAVPNKTAYEVFYDKYETRKLSSKLDVPIPNGRLLSMDDTPVSIAKSFGFPLIIKPRRSFNLEKVAFRNHVYKIKTFESLTEILKKIKYPNEYLVEKFFPGTGAGVSVLSDSGRILVAFQHRRVNEPTEGGGSSYRKSVPLDKRLLNQVERLAKGARLSGVSMFEFKINLKTNENILVEVNARFWGSLPLAVGSGVDFPYFLYKHFILKQDVVINNYKTDFYARNLVTDLYHKASCYDSIKNSNIREKLFFSINYLKDYLRLFSGNEKIDSFALKDPMPALSEIFEITQSIANKILKKSSAFTKLSSAIKKQKSVKVLKKNRSSMLSVAFICSGNICRSPFAENYYKKFLDSHGGNLKIESYGLLPLEDRVCPKEATLAGKKFNVNLNKHRSKYATNDVLEKTKLIIVFDEKNEKNIKNRGLKRTGKVINLAHLIGLDKISDPYGGSEERFIQTYNLIEKCLKKVHHTLIVDQ
ncbi:MAG: ATP-grasp domain-containing protein [Desulfobacula sp.]|nr:ATP-grasp domain-containing protein [Desulfobacula sp.]